jgi:polysaccharide export outer membrane protein
MPVLGRIQAQGKTCEELAGEIADKLRGRYLVQPNVRVSIVEVSKGKSFFIQGAVRTPGLYQIRGRPTLLELITIAGGVADNYGSTAYVIRKVKRPTGSPQAEKGTDQQTDPETDEVAQYEMIEANINGLLKGNFDNNLVVEPGDIINIPPTDVFFVAGEVRAPGSYPLKEGTSLRQAIALAQGTTIKAASSRGLIIREDPKTGKRQEIKVDIEAVMSGKKEDLPIQAKDYIIIPNSKLKSFGNAMLTGFGFSSIVTRVIRY